MNDNDLERRLRAESGPREQGYLAVPLPEAFGSLPAAPRRGRAKRGVLVVGAVAAGVLAVAAVSALMTPGTQNDVGAGGDETATPVASTSPRQPTDCQAMDVALTAEPWGGAAGSRGTVVTVRLVDGRYPCIVQRHIGASIQDANGTTLVSAVVPMIYDPVVLNPGDQFSVGVAWSNWCDGTVAEPVSLALASGGEEFPVDVPGGTDPVPPCLGEDMPSDLTVTRLEPAT